MYLPAHRYTLFQSILVLRPGKTAVKDGPAARMAVQSRIIECQLSLGFHLTPVVSFAPSMVQGLLIAI